MGIKVIGRKMSSNEKKRVQQYATGDSFGDVVGSPSPQQYTEIEIDASVADLPPLIPESEYVAGYIGSSSGKFENRVRIFLWFQIATPGDYFGKRLYFCCPGPGQQKKFGIGSKFMEALSIALGHWPTRLDRLTTRHFRSKYFRVRVTTVKLNRDKKEKPPDAWYSKIEKIIALEAGGPCL